jgi:hypothetical protein
MTLDQVKIAYPYTTQLIDDFNKVYLMKLLEDGDSEYWWNVEENLFEDLYNNISTLFDAQLPADIDLRDRWLAHNDFEQIISGVIIRYEDLLGRWMYDIHDYPTEELCDNGFWKEMKLSC